METTTSSTSHENRAAMGVAEIKDHLAHLETQAELAGFSFAAHLIGVARSALAEEAALASQA